MSLYYFLVVYILLLGFFLGTGTQNKTKKKAYLFLTFGLFNAIAALRAGSVGNDTNVYISLFKSISAGDDLSIYKWRYETGYLYLNKLLSSISSNPQIIIIVTSFIIMIGFARFINKYSRIPWLSVFLFFTLGYYGMTMNTIRLNIAIVLVLFAYDFLRERRLVKFIIIVILASLFHKTAMVFLIGWPITKLKFNYKTVISVTICSLLLYITFPAILKILLNLFPTYQYYIGSTYLDGEIRLASVLNMLVGLSIILLGTSTHYHNKDNSDLNGVVNTFNNSLYGEKDKINDGQLMLLLLVVGVAVTFLSFKFSLLDRVGDYFLVFSIIYLPNSIKYLKDKKLAVFIVFLVVVLFFTYDTSIQIIRPEWNIIYPYKFFWSN